MKTDENNKEITVIGAGIIGICSAIELQKNNWKVRVVDPNEPGQVTSFGNAGVLSPGPAFLNPFLAYGKIYQSGF